MKLTVIICKECRQVKKFDQFVTLNREEQYAFDKLQKDIEYVQCPDCQTSAYYRGIVATSN